MAWMEYFAVRSSTVYENKGLAKALLMTIALMIQRAEEGKEPTENEGWCFASERYLAESLGMSESRVCAWVEVFVDDEWLVVEQTRNAYGHRHNRYRLTDDAMGRLEKLKRERGAERPKNLNKARAGSIKNFLHARSNAEDSTREPRVSDAFRGENTLLAPSNEASALGAMKPSRSEQDALNALSAQRSGGRSLGESLVEDASPARLDTDKTQTLGTASLEPAQVPEGTLEVEDKGRGLRPLATPVGQGISPEAEPEELAPLPYADATVEQALATHEWDEKGKCFCEIGRWLVEKRAIVCMYWSGPLPKVSAAQEAATQ